MRRTLAAVVGIAVLASGGACSRQETRTETVVTADPAPTPKGPVDPTPAKAATALATFGGGCFWCTEAVFRRLEGVISAESGFAGGATASPSYRDVCDGETGHAEVIQVRYDPSTVSYEDLLEVFWKTHDPTTPNRQGADAGTQYRSIVLVHDDEQRRIAEHLKRRLAEEKVFDAPIVTQIVPYTGFWKAEDYHQDYFADNPSAGYCRAVIAPKVEKFEKVFESRLKKKPGS